jgi:hypothetical protein
MIPVRAVTLISTVSRFYSRRTLTFLHGVPLTNHRLQHAWVCSIVLLTALFSSVPAAATTVALRATIAFTEQVTTDPSCYLIGTINGGGTATRLGNVQLSSTDCINPLSPTLFLFLSDTVVLTVDNGDQIFAAYGGTLSGTNGVIQGKYFIFGGTGRFENASGVGTIDGLEALDMPAGTGSGQIQLKGTLSY